jgi:hypothetical protein
MSQLSCSLDCLLVALLLDPVGNTELVLYSTE